MHCRFVAETGDFMMFDSGLVDAEAVRPAGHDEIAVFYLHWEMYEEPGRFADVASTGSASGVQAAPAGEQGKLL